MSAAGHEFMKELWRGKIPVQFTLSSDSLGGMEYERPTAYYKLMPRMGYLSFSLEEVKSHFEHAATPTTAGADNKPIWLSRTVDGKSIPIRTHYPVGVIFDSFMLAEGKETVGMLPFAVTVRFTPPPDGTLVPMSNDAETSKVFAHHLKQSHSVRYSTAAAVTNLPLASWKEFVQSVKECSYTQFSTIRAQLKRDTDVVKLPIVIHYNTAVWLRSVPATAGPAGTDEEAAEPYTLASYLSATLPPAVVVSYDDEAAESSDATPDPKPNARVLVQGVTPAPETPLLWLSEYMSHPDGFLHVIVHSSVAPPPCK